MGVAKTVSIGEGLSSCSLHATTRDHLVPDLATYGYQRGEPCDPGPNWSASNAAQIALQRTVRPEAAVAGVVTAHARLLEAVAGLDDASLQRRGPTRFGFAT